MTKRICFAIVYSHMTSKIADINSRRRSNPEDEGVILRNARQEAVKQRRRQVGRVATGIAVTTAVLAPVVAFLNRQDRDVAARYEKTEVEALNSSVNYAWNNVVVLKEGAAVRSAPITGEDQVTSRIKPGEVLRIIDPRVYNDSYGNTWLVFTDNGKGDPDGGARDIERTHWVNYDGLVEQSKDGRSYIEVYDYPETAQAIENGQPVTSLLDVTINENDQVVTITKDGPQQVGQASILPIEAFQQELKRDQLVPAQK